MQNNAKDFGVELFDIFDIRQGIVHIIGPEQGYTQPGMTIVCGDSHTSTHGAFGALAFGIGTSEVEHVLATQTLRQERPRTMSVEVTGELAPGVTAKDVILAIINEIGVHGGIGHVIEYRGEVIRNLSMEGRMTVCNMSIEAGARAGLVAPDETTFEYMQGPSPRAAGRGVGARPGTLARPANGRGRNVRPRGRARRRGDSAVRHVGHQPSTERHRRRPGPRPGRGARRTTRVDRARARLHEPRGWHPDSRHRRRPRLRRVVHEWTHRGSARRGEIIDGQHVAESVSAMVVPGSGLVKQQAEAEGLDAIFTAAGFEWRDAGCSMCLGMNPDILLPGERSASTSNRNFEGRQGPGGRTHLVSPEMAAAAAIAGHFVDVREVMA